MIAGTRRNPGNPAGPGAVPEPEPGGRARPGRGQTQAQSRCRNHDTAGATGGGVRDLNQVAPFAHRPRVRHAGWSPTAHGQMDQKICLKNVKKMSAGRQPTACTFISWWPTFGPTEDGVQGGGGA